MSTRDDLLPPRTLPNGVVVSSGLQVDELTLGELRNKYGFDSNRIRRDEAERAGFSKEEIDREYGPDAP